MATGPIGTDKGVTTLRLVEGATAGNSPPSGASAGQSLDNRVYGPPYPQEVVVAVYSTAGSVTMTATVRLWGYLPVPGVWVPIGAGADATKGTINLQSAIGETGTDTIRHAELLRGLFIFSRVYAEITAIGGTSTAINVDLLVPQASGT